MGIRIKLYQTAIVFMGMLDRTFGQEWYCENINEDPESWTFTDGERRQKVVPRDPFKPIDINTNIMFKELRPWSTIMAEKMDKPTTILDTLEDDLDKAMLEPFGEIPHETKNI